MLTRDPWGLNERAFAWYYPKLMAVSERSGGAELRSRVIGQAAGRTLEIGAGNGYNLPHYTPAVTELVVTEPSPPMLAQVEQRLRMSPPPVGSWRCTAADAQELPFPDASFDSVTSGYVHCSVGDPGRVLDEIVRVLRPSGRYLFIEHVRAVEGSALGRVQDAVEPVHVFVAAGCHPNRRTEELLRSSPLTVEWLEHARLPMAPLTVRPLILGSARKPIDWR